MNKNTLLFALLFVGMAGLYALHFTASSRRIAYVDSARLMNGYQAMAKAKKEYEGKALSWQANLDSLSASMQDDIKQYERNSPGMNLKDRMEGQRLLKEKQQGLLSFQQAVQENARKEDERLTQKVILEVNSFLAKYGKENGCTMILVASQEGTIAYAEDNLDITDEVVRLLNNEYTESSK